MVTINIIEDIITKAISVKCSQPKYFTNKTRQTFDKFREETKDWNHEKALFVDNDGNILWEKEGNGNSVNIDEKVAWKLSASEVDENTLGYGQINIEHNHPTINGFEAMPPLLSLGDTRSLLKYANDGYLFRSITAEANGKRMSLVRKPDFKAETPMHHGNFDRKKYEKASEHLDNVLTKYIQMYGDKLAEYNNVSRSELQSMINSGKIKTSYDVSQKALDDIGSLRSLLESEGVIKEMDECGLSLLLEE